MVDAGIGRVGAGGQLVLAGSQPMPGDLLLCSGLRHCQRSGQAPVDAAALVVGQRVLDRLADEGVAQADDTAADNAEPGVGEVTGGAFPGREDCRHHGCAEGRAGDGQDGGQVPGVCVE